MQRKVILMVSERKNFVLLAAKAPLHFAPCVALVPVPPGQIALNCSVPVIMGHMAGERSDEPVESDECKAKNKSLQKFINKKLCEAGLGMWVCGMVGWWDGGMVGWWDGGMVDGGMVGWWDGGMVGWWDGGMVGWWDGGMVGWWDGGMVGWWDGGMVGWWDGGMVGWWDGGMVGWWDGGMVGWWDGGMVGWWDGGMVGWWDGGMVGWWDGGMVGWWDVEGPSVGNLILVDGANAQIFLWTFPALGQKDASSILEVVDMHLKSMNGINLATALHRFARCRLAKEHLEGVTFSSMLARALELRIFRLRVKIHPLFCPTNAPCSCLMSIF